MPRSIALQKTGARDAILDAAARVAREHGVLGLSVDRIVELAGVSKGGFFYHFPSKEALLESVVTSELDRFDSVIGSHVEAGMSYAEGLVEAILEFVATNGQMLGSVTAALASGDPIRSIVVARHDTWVARLRKEMGSKEKSALLGLAVDGLIFSCSLRTTVPSKADQALTRRALRELVA
jgi:AcrR family transcriptional regulator